MAADYSKLSYYKDLESAKDRILYRIFEIFPGFLAWATLILAFLLSWIEPVWMAIFIIAFDLYWLFKVLYLSIHLIVTYLKMKKNQEIDWNKKAEELDGSKDIYHLVLLPFYKEGIEVVRPTIEKIADNGYPTDKMVLVLATEEAGGEGAQETANKVKDEFEGRFFKFIVTKHPKGLPGELAGKGANETWAARQIKEKIIDPLNLNYEKIIVSVFDIDTIVPKGYFGILTYKYLTVEKPTRASYQPVPFYHNNLLEVPSFCRIVATSATFWQMMQQLRTEKLTTFSSHSMSFKALVDIDFWQVNMVSEDSRIFWQCYTRYNGDYRVEPLFFPVMMDANLAKTYWQTIINQYKQQRRWGWGVENVPYLLFNFAKNKKISLKEKFFHAFFVIEGFHSWATNALLIFFLGWLPLVLGGEAFTQTVLAGNLVIITRTLMTIAMIGLIVSAVISTLLLPKRSLRQKKYKYFIMPFEWILLPLSIILFGSFPGIEAQTRMMLGGKYRLGFWATEKTRK